MIQLKNMTVLDVLVQQSPQLQELERQARPGILALQERLQELERQARPGILALQERLQELERQARPGILALQEQATRWWQDGRLLATTTPLRDPMVHQPSEPRPRRIGFAPRELPRNQPTRSTTPERSRKRIGFAPW